jgi:hypothetical protein
MAMQGDLEDVAATIRSELRLEAEEAEREAAVSAAMRRDVADVARELMAHGDTVAVDAGQRRFVGHIMAVGSDVVTIDTPPRRVDVNLKTLQGMRVIERARSGGRRDTSRGAASLRARLLELHLSGEAIEAGLACSDEPILGPVALVGSDHIAVGEATGPEWFVPLTSLAYVAFARTTDPSSDLGG